MVMSISAGYSSMVSNRHTSNTNKNLGLAMARLSAGKRVLSARDDAASLAIGSRLQSEVSAQQQAYRNAGQAQSMLQIADGGLSNVNGILQRMKTLSVQAGSGQLSADERSALNTEFQALSSEVGRIAADTEFGGTKLLDGSQASVDVKVGTGTSVSDEISAPLADSTTASLSLSGLDITSAASADAASTAIDAAIDRVQTLRAENGASQNRLEYAAANIATSIENTEAASSSLIDLDVAGAVGDLASLKVQLQQGVYASKQSNSAKRSLLNLFT
jgi:flagellin